MSTRSNLGAGQPPPSGLPGTVRPLPPQPANAVPANEPAQREDERIDRTDRHGRNPGEPGFGSDDDGRTPGETPQNEHRSSP